MEIKFKNITFLFTEVSGKKAGSFTATYPKEFFYEVANFYDIFGYYLRPDIIEKFKDKDTISSLSINELIMYTHYCLHFKPDDEHYISVESSSPFFIIHDCFHALNDIVLYDKVKGCDPFYRLSCSSECEAAQLVAALNFMLENNLEVSDKYLKEVEEIYFNQTKVSLDLLTLKQEFINKNKRIIDINKMEFTCLSCKKTRIPVLLYKKHFKNKNDLDVHCSKCDNKLLEYRELKNGGVRLEGGAFFGNSLLGNSTTTTMFN